MTIFPQWYLCGWLNHLNIWINPPLLLMRKILDLNFYFKQFKQQFILAEKKELFHFFYLSIVINRQIKKKYLFQRFFC